MKSLDRTRSYFEDIHNNWGWLLGFGIVLIALGYLSIRIAAVTTLAVFTVLGAVLAVGGLIELIDAFRTRKWGGSKMNFVGGLLTLAVGILLLVRPMVGALSFTLFLGIFLMAVGFLRIFSALAVRFEQWGWYLASGILGLTLGILILLHWPSSSRMILGLFVGIDLMFFGLATVMLALAVRHLPEGTPPSAAHA